MAKYPQIKRYIACIPQDMDANLIEIRNFAGEEGDYWIRHECKEFGDFMEAPQDFVSEMMMEQMDEEVSTWDMTNDKQFKAAMEFQRAQDTPKSFTRVYLWVFHSYDVEDVIEYIEAYGIVDSHSNLD